MSNPRPLALESKPKFDPTEQKKRIKRERDKDREMVRGQFIFHEVPGGRLQFVFKKYLEDPIETYDLVDGQVYTLPLGVAKHLNTNCWYPSYEYIKGEAALTGTAAASGENSNLRISKKIRRVSFNSLEFIDEPTFNLGINQELVTVESAR